MSQIAAGSPDDDRHCNAESESKAQNSQLVRAAGLLERYHITRCQLGFDSCITVSARYTGRASLTKAEVYGAVRHALSLHVNLGIQIDNSGKDPLYIRLSTIPLSRVVTIVAEPQVLQDVISAQMESPFQLGSDLPLWRLTVLPDNTVLFACHHAIGDGQSGLAFHRAFLDGLNQPPNPLSDIDDIIPVPPNLPMAPPLEVLTNTSLSWGRLSRTFFEFLAPTSWTAGASAWTGHPVIKQPSLNTNVRLWEVPAHDVQTFLRLCKSHKATLTSAFHTLGVLVLSRLTATIEHSERFKTVYTSVPVSLRRYTGTSPDVMCDQVSSYVSYIPFIRTPPGKHNGEPFPWHMAAQFNDSLLKGMKESRQVIGTINLLVILGIFKEYFTGKLGKKREVTLEISNVGRFNVHKRDEDSEEAWDIENMYFSQCDSVCGPAMKLNLVGSSSGSVGITLTWGQGAIDDAIAEGFISGFKAEFLAILAQEDNGLT